jgi:hypothetical protein
MSSILMRSCWVSSLKELIQADDGMLLTDNSLTRTDLVESL